MESSSIFSTATSTTTTTVNSNRQSDNPQTSINTLQSTSSSIQTNSTIDEDQEDLGSTIIPPPMNVIKQEQNEQVNKCLIKFLFEFKTSFFVVSFFKKLISKFLIIIQNNQFDYGNINSNNNKVKILIF